MPALGSRSLRKDAETPAFRRSTLNPYTRFEGDSRHSSATGLSAPPHHQPSKRAASVDVPRSGSSNRVRRLSGFVDPTPPSPPRELRPQTPRFSLLRFRNASEPQLSTKAREQAIQAAVPPVPAVPPSEFASQCPLPWKFDIDSCQPLQSSQPLRPVRWKTKTRTISLCSESAPSSIPSHGRSQATRLRTRLNTSVKIVKRGFIRLRSANQDLEL